MNKLIVAILASTSAIVLSGCMLDSTHDSTTIKKISEEKLANGRVARIGFVTPQHNWDCKQLDKKSEMLAFDKMKGMLKFGGAYQVLQEQAIEYANQKKLKTNYIFLYMPSQTSIGTTNISFNLDSMSESSATFYDCKNPPSINNNFF
jgi:hypothetical protein